MLIKNDLHRLNSTDSNMLDGFDVTVRKFKC